MVDRETGVGSDAPPLHCFVAYNRSYKDVAERVAKLAKSLDIDPRIYDEPDSRSPLTAITEGLEQADFLIALLGPDFDLDPTSTKPAEWPKNEAVRAHTLKKPVVPVVHEGTEVHQSVIDAQFHPSFHFRKTESYANNVHNVARSLVNVAQTLRPPAPAMPLFYRKVAYLYSISEDRQIVTNTVSNEVVARESVAALTHITDTGLDMTASSELEVLNEERVHARLGEASLRQPTTLELSKVESSAHAWKYQVKIKPALSPGDWMAYQRTFALKNFFPLTADELEQRSCEEGFPVEFRFGTETMYGVSAEVYFQTNSLSIEYEFPADVSIEDYRALVLVDRARSISHAETERVNAGAGVREVKEFNRPTQSVRLDVENPMFGHRYILLYRPA